MPPGRTIISVAAALLLLVAAVLQSHPVPPSVRPTTRLADILPLQLPGGSSRDEPIATTEEMKRAVGELLNYDDAVFRVYQMPGWRISVYAAWWSAGKMSPRLVAAHTPDVCWPGNGWERDREAEGRHGPLNQTLDAAGLATGECRVFKIRGMSEHVVFWHKVGGEMVSYGTGYAPPWWAVFDEIRRKGLNLRQEQLFVRVSSDKPLETIWGNPETEPLRKALLRMGLEKLEKSED